MTKYFLTTAAIGILVLSACTAPSKATTDSAIAPADKTQIEAAVMDYFEGQGQGSFERLDRAFNDNASMFGVITDEDGNEGLKVWTDMNEVVKNWSKEPKPEAPARDGEILDIHVTDGRIATVHFRSVDRFYDTLTMVKLNGEWEIAAKVFVRQ